MRIVFNRLGLKVSAWRSSMQHTYLTLMCLAAVSDWQHLAYVRRLLDCFMFREPGWQQDSWVLPTTARTSVKIRQFTLKTHLFTLEQ